MTAARDPGGEATALQRNAADPGASVWVSASAGTGKTKVLTDRVLALLVTGTEPHRLLCLTFTRAAAAEMANRVNRDLGRWATMEDAALEDALEALLGRRPDAALMRRARALFARVLDAPGGMKIQTIHAFCESLLARFPLEAGLAPHFQLMDERGAAEALAEARDALLTHARAGVDDALAAALAEVTARINQDEFDALLQRLSAERARLRALTVGPGRLARTVGSVRAMLGVTEGETVEAVIEEACEDASFDCDALRRIAAALLTGSKTDVERGEAVAAWLAAPETRAGTFRAYCRGLLTADMQPYARPATKAVLAREPDAAEVLGREAARLCEVDMHLRALITANATAALLRLGRGLLDAYESHKRVHGLLDYDDLILAARDLLHRDGGASWVMYKLDEGIDHILIDEAQDTNPEQWDVIAALAEEFFAGEGAREGVRTVFAVGDRKQSIYSFQRADPAAFERMRAHFAARARAASLTWKDIDLHISFRSTPPVLAAVDAVFSRGGARDGVLGEGETIEHIPYRAGQAGTVELWPMLSPGDRAELDAWTPPVERRAASDPAAALAHMLAETIAGWIAKGEVLPSRGRAIRPGDVMVLVRQRGAFVDEMVRALKQRDVPVAGVDRMVLTEQLAVRDLVALGETLLLPEDDLTLATVLKGPLIGLAEESLFDLAWPRERGEFLWHALRRRAEERADWAEAYRYLAGLMARADFVPPFELYAEVLGGRAGQEGGRNKILGRLGPEAGDPIDEFMGSALEFECVHAPSLQHFLHWLGRGEVEVKRDLEQATRDEVRVMTVHGSKGLQAPIVLLPDTARTPRGEDALLWTAEGLMLWPPRAAHREARAEALRGDARAAQEREYRRLLYVAMTRAEDRLYVCGWRGARAASEGNWHALVEDGLRHGEKVGAEEIAPPAGEGTALRVVGPQIAPTEKQDAARGFRPVAVALPGWAAMPPPTEEVPPRPLTPSRPDEDEPSPRSPLGDDRGAAFRRGLLIHALLQALPEIESAGRRAAAEAWLARPAHGLDAAAQAEIAEVTLAVLEDPAFAALFAPGSKAEVPVTGRVGDRVISGQVDRLVVTEDRVDIVDYKSSRPAPADADSVPPVYLRQMAAYRAVLRKVYPGFSVFCAILWTDGPVLMTLPHTLLDAHAP
jgi:ATP-dependent helicase/nuclease subunit A